MKTALSIAGSDSCGGAGIQADIKTMTMNGVYAMTAITALTAQNTTGVRAIQEATPAFLKEQLDAVFEDIFPDAVKIGMVSSAELIQVIADKLTEYDAKNIVLQTVKGAVELLQATGNHPEAEIDRVTTPGGVTIRGLNEMEHAGFTSAVIRGLKAGLSS